MPDRELQENFQERVRRKEGVLRSLISALGLDLPETEIKTIYESGDEYGFYRDLSALVATVSQDILIVDAYLDEDLFNLIQIPARNSSRDRQL